MTAKGKGGEGYWVGHRAEEGTGRRPVLGPKLPVAGAHGLFLEDVAMT